MSGNRNFICTVVFIDIVEFSKKPVSEQMRIKEQLNQLLAAALREVPVKDRIILDTGDGAAVSFLGDPEDGLFLGLALRDALAAGNTLQLRTGINLGPVRLVKDINNQPNIIGDGINVAQRVMSFAQTNQILVSRSYFEVVSRLTQEYSQLFRFIGAREDKHVREHELYEVAVGGTHDAPAEVIVADILTPPPQPAAPQGAPAGNPTPPPAPAPAPEPKRGNTGLIVGATAANWAANFGTSIALVNTTANLSGQLSSHSVVRPVAQGWSPTVPLPSPSSTLIVVVRVKLFVSLPETLRFLLVISPCHAARKSKCHARSASLASVPFRLRPFTLQR